MKFYGNFDDEGYNPIDNTNIYNVEGQQIVARRTTSDYRANTDLLGHYYRPWTYSKAIMKTPFY